MCSAGFLGSSFKSFGVISYTFVFAFEDVASIVSTLKQAIFVAGDLVA